MNRCFQNLWRHHIHYIPYNQLIILRNRNQFRRFFARFLYNFNWVNFYHSKDWSFMRSKCVFDMNTSFDMVDWDCCFCYYKELKFWFWKVFDCKDFFLWVSEVVPFDWFFLMDVDYADFSSLISCKQILIMTIPRQRCKQQFMRMFPRVKLLSRQRLISHNLLIKSDCKQCVLLLNRQNLDYR